MLYGYLIVQCVAWAMNYDLLFGENAISYTEPGFIDTYRQPAFLLFSFRFAGLPWIFITGVFLLSLFSLLYRRTFPGWLVFVLNFILWLLVLNIHNKIYSTVTGGNFLLTQFLFFNCFLNSSRSTGDASLETNRSLFSCFFHNFAVLAIIIQVCFVYFLSALSKLNDADWLQGRALNMIITVHHYFWFDDPVTGYGFAGVILNYLVIAYQLLFPFSIWFGKHKRIFLIAGIGMHLYISLVMGLVGFGVVMILGYCYFWPVKRGSRFPVK